MNLLLDNPKSLFIKYLVPSVGSALVVTIYSFVDTIAIGQGVGANGTAALAVVTPIFSIPIFLAILCGIGGSVLMGVARGSGDWERGNASYTVSMVLVSIIGVIVWALMWFFREPLFSLLGADGTIMPYALEYGSVIIIAFPFMLMSAYLPNFLRTDGAPNLALASVLIGAAVNVFGDWFFVFPMDMGMFGAALATALGVVVQTGIQCIHFFTRKCTLKFVRPHHVGGETVKILANGFGSAFLEIAMVVTTVVINNLIMHYSGAAALSVYGFTLTIAALIIHIYMGVGQAAQPIWSMNFGAGKTERIQKVLRMAVTVMAVLSVLFTLSGLLFPAEITRVFVRETPEVMAIAPHILRIYFLSFIFLGVNILAILYLQSISQDRKATVLTVLRGIAVNIALLVVLPMIMGADGIWWAVVIAEAAVTIFSVAFIIKARKALPREEA